MVYAIETLAKQLKIDFGRLYSSRFTSDQDLKDWKNRLWTKVKGLHPQDMLDGYESIVDTKPGRLPEIPEIGSATLAFQKKRLNDEKKQIEAERIGLMTPKQEISESVARQNLAKIKGLLVDAMGDMGKQETAQEKAERLERLKEKSASHDDPLKKVFPLYGKRLMAVDHKCHVGWCDRYGTMSNSISGNGNWYCAEHFRQNG